MIRGRRGRSATRFPCSTLLAAVSVSAMVLLSPSARAASNYMGTGLVPVSNYNPLKLFADAMKSAERFTVDDFSGTPVAVDAQGWPLDDAGLMVWAGAANMQGTYRLHFTTQDPSVDARTVTLTLLGTSSTPQNMAYDAATNTVRYDLIVPDAAALRIFFRNTQGGLRNIKCMRPTVTGGTAPYDTSVTFTTQAKNVLGKFQVLRFMHVVNAGSSNMVAEWSQRTPPGYAQQAGVYRVGGGDAGVAWEYLIRLCNEVDADMYANIPFLATDAYVDSLANLFRRLLEPQRKIYLEYSNELWNGVAEYDARRNTDSAATEVGRGGSPLNFDGDANRFYWGWRRAGKRTKEISDIFRRVFGDNAMMARVRPLLMTQQGNGQATLEQNMILMLDYYGNPSRVADPHPPSYYFYGAGGSGYFSYATGVTDVEQVWSTGTMDTSSFAAILVEDIKWCATFGLKRVCYEGGLCQGDDAASDVLAQAWHDDRLTRATIDHQNTWSRYGGDLFVNFSMTGWTPGDIRTAFVDNVDSLDTPKMNAIDSLNATPAASPTYGNAVPCIIPGADYAACFRPLSDQPSAARPTEWYSYIVRIDQRGTYGVTVDVATTATGSLSIMADGVEIGAPSLASGGQTTPKYTAFLEPGLHGLIVRVTSLAGGRANIVRVNVTVESLAANTPGKMHLTRPVGLCAGVAGDMLQVSVSGGRAGPVVLTLSTILGRIVQRHAFAMPVSGHTSVSLPLRDLGSGLYLVRTGSATTSVILGR